jgi:hypothetical protein
VACCRNAKCPFNLSNRIREACKSVLAQSAVDWHSHVCNLPVFDGTSLTPSPAKVLVSAKRSRRNHNLSGQMAAPMSAATVSPCPIRGRIQSSTATASTNTPCLQPGTDSDSPRTGNGNERGLSAVSPQSRGVVRVNQGPIMCRRSSRQCIARLIRLRSTLHPPPGSGSFASRISRTENL